MNVPRLPDELNTILTGIATAMGIALLAGLLTLRDTARDAYRYGVENREELNARAGTMAKITAEQPMIQRDLDALAAQVNWLTHATVRIGRAIDPGLDLPPPPPIRPHRERSED